MFERWVDPAVSESADRDRDDVATPLAPLIRSRKDRRLGAGCATAGWYHATPTPADGRSGAAVGRPVVNSVATGRTVERGST